MAQTQTRAEEVRWQLEGDATMAQDGWRNMLEREAGWRMASPDILRLLELCEDLPPRRLMKVYDVATDAIMHAMDGVDHIGEASRVLQPVPEYDTKENWEAKLRQLIERAIRDRFTEEYRTYVRKWITNLPAQADVQRRVRDILDRIDGLDPS